MVSHNSLKLQKSDNFGTFLIVCEIGKSIVRIVRLTFFYFPLIPYKQTNNTHKKEFITIMCPPNRKSTVFLRDKQKLVNGISLCSYGGGAL